jgi:hypothetical protein
LEKSISKKTIVLNAPQDNDTLTGQVNFWWNEIEYARYHLQVASPNFDNPSLLVLDTVVDGYTFLYQLPAGVYQWRIRGENGNSETPYSTRSLLIITSQDLTTQNVILKTPANNQAFRDSLIFLSWFGIPTATAYELQIGDSAGNISFQQTVYGDSLPLVFGTEGYYLWKVKATNTLTETVYSSRYFYYDKTAPIQPAPTFPAYNDTVTPGPVLLQWNRGLDSGSPITDSLFIYTDSLSTISGVYLTTTNSYNYNTLPGTYYWRVRSRDNAGNVSPYSLTYKYIAHQ